MGGRYVNDLRQHVKNNDVDVVDQTKKQKIMIQNVENLHGYKDFDDVADVDLDISDL